MKALISTEAGGPERLHLADIPMPIPGPGQVRIAVAACGINYPDTLIIQDLYQYRPERPFIPGAEISGIVDAVGEGVTDFAVGDRVLGGDIVGGLAEKAILDAGRCYAMPEAMPFDVGASFLMAYGTSYHALADRAQLKRGERLLILGAAGGVGLAAVQIGKHMGAIVIAAASSAEKAEVARAHGADAVMIYPPGPLDREQLRAFSTEVRAVAGEIDVVFDPVGGSYAEAALRTLAWDGRFLVVGFPAGIPNIPLNLPLLKGCCIAGVFWGSFIERFPERNRANIAKLISWYEAGAVRPFISARYPLEKAGTAIAQLAHRSGIGKIVVTIEQMYGD